MINHGWNKRKNVKTALKSFKILKNKIPRAELHLFGDGYGPDGPAEKESRILNNDQVFSGGTLFLFSLISGVRYLPLQQVIGSIGNYLTVYYYLLHYYNIKQELRIRKHSKRIKK